MADRRWLAAALTGALLLPGALTASAHADERQAAKNRVTVAKRQVARLQAKAELAIERHNAALGRARAAAGAREAAVSKALAAQAALASAQEAARLAGAAADAATGFAQRQEQAARAAQDDVVAAQTGLDRMAAGSYRSGGSFALVAQLATASDPLELARGRLLVNQVAEAQHETVLDLADARDLAAAAAADAAAAQDQAVHAEEVASQALSKRDAASRAAQQANRTAALAAQAAHRAADDAHRARSTAEAAVAAAEAVLHRAVRTSARLEAAARQARIAASHVPPTKATSAAARTAIQAALDQVGVPYSWGGGDENGPTYGYAQGAGTKGFDCSGLTLYAYAQAGIRLDHYSGSQWHQGKRIKDRADLKPGDLMFFAFDPSDEDTIHHVSIYLGDGRMVEAPYTGEVVRVTSWARDDFIGGTRPWA